MDKDEEIIEQLQKVICEIAEFKSNFIGQTKTCDARDVTNLLGKACNKVGLNPILISSKLVDFRHTLSTETDRGCALMTVAFLDEQLQDLLKNYLVRDVKIFTNLFSGVGGLSSFSSRIDLAYLLGLIGPKTKRDLNLLRPIRNEFAHSMEDISFDDPGITNRCSELYNISFQDDLKPREKYTRAAFGIMGNIDGIIITTDRIAMGKDVEMNSPIFDMLKEALIEEARKLD